MSEQWKDKLFEDKSLWDIYKKSQKWIRRRASNQIIVIISILLLLIITIASLLDFPPGYNLKQSFLFAHKIADVGFTLSLGILGFLVAGFAVFASVTKAELFIILAQLPHKEDGRDTDLSGLQFIFFNFMNVFSIYIVLLIFSLFVDIGFSEGSPIRIVADHLASTYPKLAHFGNTLVSCVLLMGVIEAMLRLKSFVWNMYQSVLISIAAEHELAKGNSKPKA